jgi:hypothetical protein
MDMSDGESKRRVYQAVVSLPMTTKADAFLFAGYKFQQEQDFKKLREQLRTNLKLVQPFKYNSKSI